MTSGSYNLTFVALFSVIFMVIFSFTLPIMASTYIVSDLGGSTTIGIYGVCFYGIGNALGIPLGRPLAYKFGAVKVLCFLLYTFALMSLLCGLAANFPLFLLLRVLQGFVAGPFYALSNGLLAALTPSDKKQLFTQIFLTIFSTVPILGACWGGWIAYDYNWRLTFFFNMPIICLIAGYIGYRLKEFHDPFPAHNLDGIGYVFYVLAVFFLSFVAITGQEFDWLRSPMLVTMIVVGGISLLFFILWSLFHPHPLLEFSLFKAPLFTFGIVNLALLFSAYFGIVVLMALWLSLYVNYTPIWVGLLLGIMLVAGFIPSILVGPHFGKTDARIPLGISLICLIISSFHTTIFNEYIDFERIAYSRILAGFALVFFLPPVFRLCYHSLPETKSLQVLELFQVVRAISSSVGVALYLILWQRRQVFYHDRQGSELTAFSMPTKEYYAAAKGFHITGTAADAQLNVILDRQSIALALDDCFFFMGWVTVGLLFYLLSTLLWRNNNFAPERKALK